MSSSSLTGTPRRVLMCVSGMSPAVVTETLYALTRPEVGFVPDEIHVVTTLTGRDKLKNDLLDPQHGHFHAFMREWLPGRTIRFDEGTIHVIREQRGELAQPGGVWSGLLPGGAAPEPSYVELDDITTDENNRAAADTIFAVMRRLKAERPTVLHASVAGGRKSMSFYMGHAFSLLSDPGDALSHVLVNEPFESPALNFFYPPRTPVTLRWTDRAKCEREISTQQADIRLAELSVLRLGPALREFPIDAQTSFAEAVALAQAVLVPQPLRITLEPAAGRGRVELCGRSVKLPPQPFIALAIYAWARQHADELPEGDAVRLCELPAEVWREMADMLAPGMEGKEIGQPHAKTLKPVHSAIHTALGEAVGPAARHYRIELAGAKAAPGSAASDMRPYRLGTDPALIELVGLRAWAPLLRKVLGGPAVA